MQRRLCFLLAMSLVGCLAACGDGPSQSDVRKAHEEWAKNLEDKTAAMYGRVPSDADYKIVLQRSRELKLIGCEKRSEDMYDCEVERSAQIFRMQKYDGQWKIGQFVNR